MLFERLESVYGSWAKGSEAAADGPRPEVGHNGPECVPP